MLRPTALPCGATGPGQHASLRVAGLAPAACCAAAGRWVLPCAACTAPQREQAYRAECLPAFPSACLPACMPCMLLLLLQLLFECSPVCYEAWTAVCSAGGAGAVPSVWRPPPPALPSERWSRQGAGRKAACAMCHLQTAGTAAAAAAARSAAQGSVPSGNRPDSGNMWLLRLAGGHPRRRRRGEATRAGAPAADAAGWGAEE